MKTITISFIAFAASFVCAEEPAQLTNLRQSYEKEISRVKTKYAEALITLKESYVRSGNLKAVEIIQKEILLVQQSELPNWVYGSWRLIGAKGKYTFIIEHNGICREGANGASWSYLGQTLEIRWFNGAVDKVTIPSRKKDSLDLSRVFKGKPADYKLERVES